MQREPGDMREREGESRNDIIVSFTAFIVLKTGILALVHFIRSNKASQQPALPATTTTSSTPGCGPVNPLCFVCNLYGVEAGR